MKVLVVPDAVAVLITRPQPQADRLAAELRDRLGPAALPVVAPLMRTRRLPVTLPEGPFAGLLLTSEAGAEAASGLRLSAALPATAHCVGERTAEVARQGGFVPGTVAPTAKDLLARLAASPVPGPLLYLHGRDITAALDRILAERGTPAFGAAVYAQDPLPLTDAALALLRRPGPVILPLYSARSARLFLAACPADMRAGIRPVVLSQVVQAALPPALAARAATADAPDGPAMLAAIGRVISSLAS